MEKTTKIDEKLRIMTEVETFFGNTGKKETICPICGGIIRVIDYGSAYEIKCDTEGCLYEVGRGL